MTWFKVDDSFHSHPKVLATSPAALGLWVIAGSWSSAHLTEGFVPDDVVQRLLPGSGELVVELITAGLWERVKRGYRFHEWLDRNPTKAEAVASRAKKSSGGALGNHRRWHVDKGVSNPQCAFCQEELPSDIRSDNRHPNRIGGESLTNPPSRPDPIGTSVSTKPQVAGRSPPKDDDHQPKIDYAVIAARAAPLIGAITAVQAHHVANQVLANANGEITNPINYVLTAIAREPNRYRPAGNLPNVRDLCRHGLTACDECEKP